MLLALQIPLISKGLPGGLMKSVRGLIDDMACSQPPKWSKNNLIEPFEMILGVSLTSTREK